MSNKTYSPGSVEKRKSTADNNKSKEKDDMIGLNDKFVQLIDKVKTLENEKQKLDKKLELLKGNESYKGNVDDLVRQMENELEQKIDELVYEKDKLEDDHKIIEKEKIENKKRYEEESKKKNEVEGDCIIARKGVDDGHRNLVDDALKLEKLNRKLDFLRAGFDEEINELKSMIKNESVVLPDESKYSIDMTEIIKKVKAQYANMAARAREDAEYWNQRKIDALVIKSGQREQEARDLKRQISDLNRTIQRLQADLDALKRKKDALIAEINDLRNSGEKDLDKIREDIRSQELALKDRKKDLAQQIKDHQNLLNIKLALDIEIATYCKLLEGEEQRMNQSLANTDVHLPERKHPKKKPQAAAEPTVAPETILNQETTVTPETTESTAITPVQKKRLLIRLEVESGRFVSESSQYTD